MLERLSGVLAHPTSFPSRYGIGDLGKHAYDFVDFLHKGKQTLWQVLPLNPTSFGDSPYQSFSTFAGNPMLVSPDKLVENGLLAQEDLYDVPEFDPCITDYGKVIPYKNGLLKKAYANFKELKKSPIKTKFTAFCKAEKEWLDNYCLFVALKFHFIEERKNMLESAELKAFAKENEEFLTEDQINDYFYGAVWNSWPEPIAKHEKEAVTEWTKTLKNEIELQKFMQFLFFEQWFELKEYANAKGIKIIGDIPIFVAMDSADVWSDVKLFQIDEKGNPYKVAGVPPDYFSATGQLWGNPLYDWEVHQKTNFAWWIKRVSSALKTVDILRIDHFRGFESYWAIEYGEKTAINGEWVKAPGKELFAAIKKELGSLPIIAEDLGIITDKVEKLRDSLKLPGMKVLQFGYDAKHCNLNMPHMFATQNLVVYSGTHDNDTSLGWYRNAPAAVQDQFRRYMNVSGDSANWDLIRLACLSIAGYAIFPVQDVLGFGSDARMNVPGVASGNWQFRFREHDLTEQMAENLAYLSLLSDRNLIKEDLEEPEEAEEIEK